MPKRIQIDQIIVETRCRHTPKDLYLTDNIYNNGQIEPVTVMGPENGKYYLINGYRRMTVLKKAGHKYIQCDVLPLSSQSERALLRLSINHHTEKFSRFNEIPLVEQLQNDGYTSKEIHSKTNIPKGRLYEHKRAINLPLSLRQRAEEADVNPEGIVQILKITNINPVLVDSLINMYLLKQLPLSKIPLIKNYW
jgi:ParB-like chromosome segregation protein Spo0J